MSRWFNLWSASLKPLLPVQLGESSVDDVQNPIVYVSFSDYFVGRDPENGKIISDETRQALLTKFQVSEQANTLLSYFRKFKYDDKKFILQRFNFSKYHDIFNEFLNFASQHILLEKAQLTYHQLRELLEIDYDLSCCNYRLVEGCEFVVLSLQEYYELYKLAKSKNHESYLHSVVVDFSDESKTEINLCGLDDNFLSACFPVCQADNTKLITVRAEQYQLWEQAMQKRPVFYEDQARLSPHKRPQFVKLVNGSFVYPESVASTNSSSQLVI